SVTPSADRGTDGRDAEALPQSVVDPKEEGLVLLDRPSDGTAKLITGKSRQPPVAGRSFVVEEVAGIERAVSEVFKQRAMQRVRPALGDYHHLASHGHAIFGAEGVGDHAVLPDSFNPQRTAILGSGGAVGQIRHEGAVQQII